MDVIFVFIYWIKSSFSQYYSHMRTRFFVFPACLVSSFIQYNTYIESYDQSMLIMFSFAIKNPYYIFSHLRLFFEFDFLFQYFQDTQSAAAISLVKFPHLWNFRRLWAPMIWNKVYSKHNCLFQFLMFLVSKRNKRNAKRTYLKLCNIHGFVFIFRLFFFCIFSLIRVLDGSTREGRRLDPAGGLKYSHTKKKEKERKKKKEETKKKKKGGGDRRTTPLDGTAKIKWKERSRENFSMFAFFMFFVFQKG